MGKQVASGRPALLVSRHLRWESFEERIRDGLPSVEPIDGTPRVLLFIAPGGKRIGIRLAAVNSGSLSSPLAEIELHSVGSETKSTLEVSTGNPALFRDFYAFCCTVADRVQINHDPVETAIRTTLTSWAALLRRKSLLAERAQTGLYGELLFLKRVASVIGWASAIDSWQGPYSEEHDFTLPYADVEVKSTRQERRIHHVTSITQLMPKKYRRLVVVSVQVTPGIGQGSESLPEIISSVVASTVAEAPQAVDSVRQRLTQQGWVDEDAAEYSTRYHLRTPIAAVPVDGSCPAILPSTLAGLGTSRFRISEVEYVVDLDGLGFTDGQKQFNRLLFRR